MELNRVRRVNGRVAIRNVIVSVFDKNGLDLLVPGLLALSPEVRIYSTGNTFKTVSNMLSAADRQRVVQISDYTGQPEMQGGLVKTLDYRIYLGLLSESFNESHQQDLQRTRSVAFDMTVCNLYPFQQVVATEGASLEDARAHIDIGGPCMLRASAKNFLRVLALCVPDDYGPILKELKENDGTVSLETRYACARKVFRHTAEYDAAIAEYLSQQGVSAGGYEIGVE